MIFFFLVVLAGCKKDQTIQSVISNKDVANSCNSNQQLLDEISKMKNEIIPLSSKNKELEINNKSLKDQILKLQELNSKETNEFTYSDSNHNFPIEKQEFIVREKFDVEDLVNYSAECGQNKDKEYFQELMSSYSKTDKGVSYTFKYNKPSQDPNYWTVTLIPNQIGYKNTNNFYNDFSLCFAGGDLYPKLVSDNYLFFIKSCGSGYNDGSGLPIGCGEIREIIEPTIKLK